MKFKTIFGNFVKYVDVEEKDARLFLTFSFYRPLIDEIKAMKGAQWHPEIKCWSIDICKRNFYAFDILKNSERYTKYFKKENTLINPHKHFWSHQVIMYQSMKRLKRVLLAAEMRTGKTLPTMTVFEESEYDTCWWVTTKTAALGIERERQKWFPQSKKILNLLTYDKFTSILDVHDELLSKSAPGFLVFDECHKLKTPVSQRSMAALKLSDYMEDIYKDVEYVIGLSGTPAPKDPSDWWTQCEVIRCGFIREGTINKFRQRYGQYLPYDPENVTPAWERFKGWDKKEVSALAKRLSGLVYIFTQKECLDLPPKRYEIIRLTPSDELLRVAKTIVKTEDNCLRARSRLRQLSDGFQYNTTYNEEEYKTIKETDFVGSPKIDRLKSDLEEHEDIGRLVIYAGFHGSLDIIRKTCLSCGWNVLQIDGRGQFLHKITKINPLQFDTVTERSEVLLALSEMDRSTNERKINKLVLVAHPISGGAGLELSAAPTFIYYSNDDSGEGRMQSESRGYSNNMDKTRGLTIIDYILLPTDELVRNKLVEKKELQSISLGQLKECLDGFQCTNFNADIGKQSNNSGTFDFSPPW